MFLSKEEKILVLLYRIELERLFTLYGKYKGYIKGMKKIGKLRAKIEKLGGDPDMKINVNLSGDFDK